MRISWPELSTAHIEDKATSLREAALEKLGLDASGPVPVEQIAEMYLGYELEFFREEKTLPSSVIGGIDFFKKTIIINSSIEGHIGRYSFTIAHEIGHHVLHRDLFVAAKVGDKIMCRGGANRSIEEIQADKFAEALLMPKELVITSSKSIQSVRPLLHKSRIALAAKVIKASGLSNVSVTAMDIRLQHLKLSIKSNSIDNVLKWSRKHLRKDFVTRVR